jgi:hypothetical protein
MVGKLTTSPLWWKLKVNNTQIYILIDPGATLSYITPGIIESNRLKKMRHVKSWLVQLATGTKGKWLTLFLIMSSS